MEKGKQKGGRDIVAYRRFGFLVCVLCLFVELNVYAAKDNKPIFTSFRTNYDNLNIATYYARKH